MKTSARAFTSASPARLPDRVIHLSVDARQVAFVLFAGLGVLALLDIYSIHLTAQGSALSWKMSVLAGRLQMGEEVSLPTWASSVLLAFNAGLLLLTAQASRKARDGSALHWAGLALIIMLLSMEEIAQFHEALGSALRHRFGTTGVLYFAWVIPGIFFALIVLLTYTRFLLRLPTRERILFLLAGGLYILGAVGAEMVGSAIVSARLVGVATISDTQYLFVVLIEESLEILGQALFAYALVDHLAARGLCLTVGQSEPGAAQRRDAA